MNPVPHEVSRRIPAIRVESLADSREHLHAAGSRAISARGRGTGKSRTQRHDTPLAQPAPQDVLIASHIAAVATNGFTQQTGAHEDCFKMPLGSVTLDNAG